MTSLQTTVLVRCIEKLLLEDTEGDRICDDLAGLKHIFLSFSKLSAITSRPCHEVLVEITFQRSLS